MKKSRKPESRNAIGEKAKTVEIRMEEAEAVKEAAAAKEVTAAATGQRRRKS